MKNIAYVITSNEFDGVNVNKRVECVCSTPEMAVDAIQRISSRDPELLVFSLDSGVEILDDSKFWPVSVTDLSADMIREKLEACE